MSNLHGVVRGVGLRTLLLNGFPAPLAARIYATPAHYVLGFAMQLPADIGR